MIFLLAIAFVLIGYLNPFLAVVYGVGMVGDRLLKSGKMNTFFITAFAGMCLLGVSGKLNKVDFFELALLLLTLFVYFHVLLAKDSYSLAILASGIVCFGGEFAIFTGFSSYYLQIIQRAFAMAGQVFVSEGNSDYLTLAKNVYLHNYPSLYAVLSLGAFYVSSMLLGKKNEIPEFAFREFTLPKWVDIWLIAGLFLFLFRGSLPWSMGSNLLIFVTVAYMLVGMGVIFTVWKKWFEKSKILYVLFGLLIVLNNLLLFVLSFLGLLDRWFDFRKLNRRKDESNFN